MGDLKVQSGLIAHTRDDLETLKHRGDRNIYEFALQKGARPTPVSTVSLQHKKVDGKKGKYTLNVRADDRTIEVRTEDLEATHLPAHVHQHARRQINSTST